MIKNVKKIVSKYWRKHSNAITNAVSKELKKVFIIDKLQTINQTSNTAIVDEANKNFIVSLTTFGRRINDVYLSIESIDLQTLKPSKVVLWLAEEEFNQKNLPVSLTNLQKRGLTIDYCKDIKSYKKLIPSLKKFENKLIVTIDDDVMYNCELLEVLHKNYRTNPDIIYCGFARRMQVSDNILLDYNNWPEDSKETHMPSKLNFPIGFSGVLYFPGCFHKDVLDEKLFMRLSPYADDIWFKMMSLLKGIEVKSIGDQFSITSNIIPIEIAQEDSLSILNVVNKKNDEQLRNVFNAYNGYNLLR
jgi:hypothetical protein